MKILILDEQGLFLDAAVLFLQRVAPEIGIMTASTFQAGLDYLRRQEDIRLILVDMQQINDNPAADPLTLIDRLKAVSPDSIIGLVSNPLPRSVIDQALAKGVKGYFPKGMRAEAFVQALRYILTGETFLPYEGGENARFYKAEGKVEESQPAQAGFSYHGAGIKWPDPEKFVKKTASTDDLLKLSSRELQTLAQLGQGLSNKEIANKFDIQEVTVKQHVRGLLRKLGIKNRTEAALIARDLDL